MKQTILTILLVLTFVVSSVWAGEAKSNAVLYDMDLKPYVLVLKGQIVHVYFCVEEICRVAFVACQPVPTADPCPIYQGYMLRDALRPIIWLPQ